MAPAIAGGRVAAAMARHVRAHLEQLTAMGERPGTAAERLEAVLEAYALIITGETGPTSPECSTAKSTPRPPSIGSGRSYAPS